MDRTGQDRAWHEKDKTRYRPDELKRPDKATQSNTRQQTERHLVLVLLDPDLRNAGVFSLSLSLSRYVQVRIPKKKKTDLCVVDTDMTMQNKVNRPETLSNTERERPRDTDAETETETETQQPNINKDRDRYQ